jgi:hypothetical protein
MARTQLIMVRPNHLRKPPEHAAARHYPPMTNLLRAICLWCVIAHVSAFAATPRPVIEWVQPPAWRQSADRVLPLLPGMTVQNDEAIMTGTGGAAEIRLGQRSILLLESTVWAWTGARDAPTGEVRQGGIHTADSTAGLEYTDRRRHFRVYPSGQWHLTLALIANRPAAEQMAGFFRRNGYPTDIFEAMEKDEPVFRVAIPGFQSQADAQASADALRGRFPGIVGPRADAAPAAPPVAVMQPPLPHLTCTELGPFTAAVLKKARPVLDATIPGKEPRERAGSPEIRWWVHIPPRESRADAVKVVADLKRRGIKEFYIVPDAPHKHAISLGLFAGEQGARRYAELMASKGVTPVEVITREGTQSRTFLQWPDLGPAEAAKISSQASQYPGVSAAVCQ